MGFFFADGDTGHSIHYNDLKKHFDKIPILDEKEKQYLMGRFEHKKEGSLTKREIEQELREMQHDTNDLINPEEVQAIKRKLFNDHQ